MAPGAILVTDMQRPCARSQSEEAAHAKVRCEGRRRNFISAYWTVYWNYGGTLYYAQATSNGAAGTGVVAYTDGTYTSNFNTGNGISGTAKPRPNGTLVMDVPLADVGNPPALASHATP